MRLSRGPKRVLLLALIATGILSPQLVSTDAALAQETDELFGYQLTGTTTDSDSLWIDPVLTLLLNPSNLEEPPDFDVAELHDSTVFASGVDWMPIEDDTLHVLVEHHVRVLQVIETLDRDLDVVARDIRVRQPQVEELNEAIAHEHAEEARLADEITILNTAIAEFAVRAFISEDELDTALSLPDTQLSETRVVSDEVRGDQFVQIHDREAELAERQARRSGFEEDLRVLRSELRILRRDRLGLLRDLRSMESLAEETASTYQDTLHRRLDAFVDGTDLPLVALNAYVIAARLQEIERPECQIEWWMLAGIGKIESFHGHFGNSTLDINGSTTEPITGPALDGRILEGAEFLVDGADLPGAADRTEIVEIEVAVPTIDDASVEPTPPAPDAAVPEVGAISTPEAAAVIATPKPVVKRLALIADSDGGRLDGDPTYDRAVGPMQFIPQTWNQYDVDANLDEKSDPNNIYDAALASATYLCTAAGSMATVEGQQRGYFAYNHDLEYSENVTKAAEAYRRLIALPEEPEGSAHELGIANPELIELASRTAEASKVFDDPSLPDW